MSLEVAPVQTTIPPRPVVPREWYQIAEGFRAELRRFGFGDELRRLLDVLISYTLCRGRLDAQIARGHLMTLARLDKFQLSKALGWLRYAGMIRVTENVPRKDRARLHRQDCPTIELLLECSSWFKASGRSNEDRKQLKETELQQARLLHNGLCELNPVQVELPPMGLLEAYALAEQECAQARLAAEAAGCAIDSKLAERAGAIGEMPAIGKNDRSASASSPDLVPSRPENSPPTCATGAPPSLRRRLLACIDDPTMQKQFEENPAAFLDDSSCFKNNCPPKSRPEAVVYKTTAPPDQQLSIKQLPKEAPPPEALNQAVVLKTTASPGLPLKSPPRSLSRALTPKNSQEGKECEGREPLPSVARGFQLKAEFENEFLERLRGLCERSRDDQTIDKRENWWRLAFLASPGAAVSALDELELRVKNSTKPERVANCGSWMLRPYRLAGGSWIGKSVATPEQRAYFAALG